MNIDDMQAGAEMERLIIGSRLADEIPLCDDEKRGWIWAHIEDGKEEAAEFHPSYSVDDAIELLEWIRIEYRIEVQIGCFPDCQWYCGITGALTGEGHAVELPLAICRSVLKAAIALPLLTIPLNKAP